MSSPPASVTALVQFSGSPNTEQFRLVEFLSLCSNPDLVGATASSAHASSAPVSGCTCCCFGCADSTRTNSTFSSQRVRILGGCPVLCNAHPKLALSHIFATPAASCACCHQPGSSPTPSLSLEDWRLVCARTFAAFHQHECGCLFVEAPSLDFLRRVVERSMMIACAWVVGGAGSDDQRPEPEAKALADGNKWQWNGDADGDNTATRRTGTFDAIEQSLLVSQQQRQQQEEEEEGKDGNRSGNSSATLSFFAGALLGAKRIQYRIEYASGCKYGNEYAREYVNTQLVPHPVHAARLRQQYDFRAPDATLLMFVVPSADLPNQKTRHKIEKARAIIAAAATKEAGADDAANDEARAQLELLVTRADPHPRRTFYVHCAQLAASPRGLLMSLFSVKHRRYIGTTTMVPELTFLMVNCARVRRGDLVLDPFCGTGSIPIAARYLGAHLLGFDIDGRVMRRGTKESSQSAQAAAHREADLRAKLPELLAGADALKYASRGSTPLSRLVAGGAAAVRAHVQRTLGTSAASGKATDEDGSVATDGNTATAASSSSTPSTALPASFRQNFDDFGLGFGPNCFVGSFSAFSKSFGARTSGPPSQRRAPWLDAIVTDPPYGIRETKRMTEQSKSKQQQHEDAEPEEQTGEQGPASWHRPLDSHPLYEATELLVDLVHFAATSLVAGGRLVFWMSVTSYDYHDDQIPKHPWMRVVSNIPQQLNAKAIRRLIVMEKEEATATVTIVPTREEMLRSTMRGLELRKAVDMPVPESVAIAAAAAAAAALSTSDMGDDAAAAAVALTIQTAQRKREERQRKNEESAQWRREHNVKSTADAALEAALQQIISKKSEEGGGVAGADDGGGGDESGAAAASIGRKALIREMNVLNRAKNVEKKQQVVAAQQLQQQHQQRGNNAAAAAAAGVRDRDEASQPGSKTPPRSQ